LVLLIAITSCTHSQNMKVPSKECIALNNKGVDYLMIFPTHGDDELNKAIDCFKQAIQLDSTYATAYINISIAYHRKLDFADEMKTYNVLLVLTNNSPSIQLMKGVLFERINNIDSAKLYYNFATIGYEKEQVRHPDNAENIKALILLKALTDGKDAALKKLDEQIKAHPELQGKLSGEYEYYKSFDRHNYIYDLPTEVEN